MKKAFLIGALIISSLVSNPFKAFSLSESGEELKLYLGEPKVISVSSPTRIVIGNPSILDVNNVTKAEMTLNPKAAGKTVLIFWDNFGEQSYQVRVLAEHLEDIKDRIDSILEKIDEPDVYTELQEEEGKIFLLGRIEKTEDKKKIESALGSLKEKITDLTEAIEEQTAVEIDVQVLELDKDATKEMGFSWPGTFNVTEDHFIDAAGAKKFPMLWDKRKWDRDGFSFSFKALLEEGKARILSRPRLSCQSGKEAELFVGGEKPIFTTDVASAGGEGTQVQYKEYGIKLKIKPTVGENDRIKVQLKIEVSEVGAADVIGEFNDKGVATKVTAKAYPLVKRNADTELYLENGETLAIGGLIRQKLEEDVHKTPGLGDLPVLGALFRQKSTKKGGGKGERGDSELFITLTPKIVARNLDSGKKKINRNSSVVRADGYSAISAGRKPSYISEYSDIIKRRIVDNLNYPQEALQSGFEGEVNLSLHLSYTGQLLDAVVKNSSGHKVLDNNAVSTARVISYYPPFPPSIENKELWIDVPIDYRLN